MNKVITLSIGSAGAGAIEIASNIDMNSIQNGSGGILQIIIGIITIVKLLKKSKNDKA